MWMIISYIFSKFWIGYCDSQHNLGINIDIIYR